MSTNDQKVARVEDQGPTYPSTSVSVSLLIPFDIGQTFIFKSPMIKPSDVKKQWTSIFDRPPHRENWNTEQWSGFKKPMGWIATWRCFTGPAEAPAELLPITKLKPALKCLQKTILGKVASGADAVRAVIFPNGMGILIIRITAPETWRTQTWIREFRQYRKRLRLKACSKLVAWVAKSYLDYMRAAIKRNCKRCPQLVSSVFAIERTHGIMEAKYAYPIFFFDGDDINDGCDSGAWFKAFQARANSEKRTPKIDYDDATVNIGWGECVVQRCTEGQVSKIERDFAIGLASWFALVVMTDRSTLHIRDAIYALATGTKDSGTDRVKAIRLAYSEAANQASPIQWTSGESDLFLLEAIHKCWISERWWRIVEQKTNLLAAHWDQQTEETNERWGRRIAALGATIACVALASAVADLITLIMNPPTSEGSSISVDLPGLKWQHILLDLRVLWSFVTPGLLAAIVLFGFIIVPHFRRRSAHAKRFLDD